MTHAERAALRLWTSADASPGAIGVTVSGHITLVVWTRPGAPAGGVASFLGFPVVRAVHPLWSRSDGF